MRYVLRALVGVFAMAWLSCHTPPAQAGPSWWPFGGDREAAQSGDAGTAATAAPPTAQPTTPSQLSAEQEPEQSWMIDSPLAKVSWPRLHMPEMPKPVLPRPWPKRSEVEAARNAWVEENPQEEQPSPLQALNDGANRVKSSTRAAWDKTVDALTPGESRPKSSRVARRGAQQSWWRRMFLPEEPQGPQTVTEWMAQDRVDP
jgi:hypothetical protein